MYKRKKKKTFINFKISQKCMKRNIQITLDEEIVELLKQTGNKSGTINKAMIEYLNTQKTLEQNKEDKLKRLRSLEFEINELNQDVIKIDDRISIRNEERIKIKEEEHLKQEEEQKIIKEERREKEMERRLTPEFAQRFKTMQIGLFKGYEIAEDMIDPLFDEYLKLYQKDIVRNIVEFMELKNIKEKPKEKPKESEEHGI